MDRKLFGSIMAIAVPAVVTNITTPLLALCDVAIVGHMGSAVYIAAISVGGTMFNMLYWLCGFLRMGSSGTTAQAFGAADMTGAMAICRRGLLIASVLGLAMILCHGPVASLLINLIDASGATRELALSYFDICIWGAPAVLGTFALTGWFLGMQDARVPMWVSIFINLFNIAVSVTLVYGCGWRMEGVAVGTLSAQWAGFAVALFIALKRMGRIKVTWARVLDRTELGRFFRINTDIFFRTLCLVAVTLWFTRVGAMQGTVMLAVNALLMQMFTIFSYMMDGLAFAGEALCGRYAGAADKERLRSAVKGLFEIGLGGSAVFTLVYFAGGDALLGLLSSEQEVVSRAHEFFAWAVSIPLVSFIAFVWDGVMIGLTRTRAMLASMIAGAGVFFGLYLWLFPRFGNHGLWIAFLAYLFMRGVVLTLSGRKIFR